MGLRTIDLKKDITVTVTDGTSLGFVEDGLSIPNGIHMACSSDVDFLTRKSLTAKVRQPTVNTGTGAFGKDKKSIVIAEPVNVGGGKIVFNTLRIEREIHPVAPEGAAVLNQIGVQVLSSEAMADFWNMGGLN